MERMKILLAGFFAGILFACSSTRHPSATKQRDELLSVLRKTNQYFMNKWPDAGKPIFTYIERPSHIWTRSVYYEGLLALHSIDPLPGYLDYVQQWGDKHQWGLRGGVRTRNADNQCCGQVYLDYFLLNGQQHPEWIRDIQASIDSMRLTPKVDDWTWVDALQMAMPVYARLGRISGDTSYWQRMHEMYLHTRNRQGGSGLYNTMEHLWWRDKDFLPPYKEPNGGNCYWSRGNGWVVAALVRVMEQLPASHPFYAIYLQDYRDLLEALLPLQREDGFWNVSLADPTHFGGKELTGTSLFIYGMAWGINRGLLDRDRYLPAIKKAWASLVKDCVHPDGSLGYVQGTGKEPKDGQPVSYDHYPDFEDYGLGCFLLAGTQIYQLKD